LDCYIGSHVIVLFHSTVGGAAEHDDLRSGWSWVHYNVLPSRLLVQ
jgi:hypothetical protein